MTRSGHSRGQAELRCADLMPARGIRGGVGAAVAHTAPCLHHS